MPSTPRICRNCRAFELTQPDLRRGECHGPISPGFSGQRSYEGWPELKETDWCLGFTPRQPPPDAA